MNCELSPENARQLDRITALSQFTTLTIQTADTFIIVQFLQDDKSFVCNIKLTADFFKALAVNTHSTFNIQRVKFFRPRMTALQIRLTKYLFILKWTFPEYEHIKELCIADSSLYALRFEPSHLVTLECFLVHEVLKYFHCRNICLDFSDNKLQIRSKEGRVEVETAINVRCDLRCKIEVPLNNIKKVFSHYGIGSDCLMAYESSGVALNFAIECPDLSVSFFLAIYS